MATQPRRPQKLFPQARGGPRLTGTVYGCDFDHNGAVAHLHFGCGKICHGAAGAVVAAEARSRCSSCVSFERWDSGARRPCQATVSTLFPFPASTVRSAPAGSRFWLSFGTQLRCRAPCRVAAGKITKVFGQASNPSTRRPTPHPNTQRCACATFCHPSPPQSSSTSSPPCTSRTPPLPPQAPAAAPPSGAPHGRPCAPAARRTSLLLSAPVPRPG